MTVDISAESDEKNDKQLRITAGEVGTATVVLQIMSFNESQKNYVASSEILLSRAEALILSQSLSIYFEHIAK